MPGTKKAVLCDLDGIFFELVDHFGEYGVAARLEQEVILVDGLGETLTALVESGFIVIGHTNQPDIARKKITPEFLEKKHGALLEKYPQIKKIFVCPHTDTDPCDCRKPKPGLLIRAAKEFDIDFSVSWVIGDSRTDIDAGEVAHAKTILVQTKYNCGTPAIAIATKIVRSTKGALKLILDIDRGTSSTDDV